MPSSQLSGPDSGTSSLLAAGLLTRSRHSGPTARAGRSVVYLEHLVILLVALYVVAGALVYTRLGDRSYLQRLLVPRLWGSLGLLAPFGALAVLVYHRLKVRGPDGRKIPEMRAGWRRAWNTARQGPFSNGRLLFAVAAMVASPLFFNAFSAWKVAIPALHPFSRDILFATMDARLHGGPPHRLLAWIPLQPLDLIYFFAWGEMLVLTLVILAWRAETRILLAFVLTWIALGTGLASLGSSAGPPYFLALTGRDTYAGLIAHLAVARDGGPLIASLVQHSLWSVYVNRAIVVGGGISAFPSMHVAVPALLAFATWRRSRILSVGLAAFTLLILVSSVALGWHYAVDGYASILGSGIIWLLVARLPIPELFGPAGARMRV